MSLNMATFVDTSASENPGRIALKLDQYCLTYAELAMGIQRVANVLKSKGVGRGDKVAIMLPNTPHFPMLYYAILRIGAVVVPLNCLLKAPEIQYQLADSEAKAFFTWKLFEAESAKAFAMTETCEHLIVVTSPDDHSKPEVGEAFMPLVLSALPDCDVEQMGSDDTAVLLYTSGTTGQPKGAELTHFNIFFNAFYAKDYILKAGPGDVGLVVLPLFHTFGQTCVMNVGLMAGATLTMLPSFDTRKTLEVIQRDKVTFMAAVPTMFFWILSLPEAGDYDLSSLRMAVSGGAALPVEVLNRFHEKYGVHILEGYGLTETSPVCSFNMPDRESKAGSIGTPIWGVDMRIMRNDGTFADTDEVGEIVVRGHNLMKGYYKNPKATESTIIEGWFHTGDVGRRDSDGYFFIVDRKKDLIIRGGMNVYPREVEEVLYAAPGVVEACVIGVPDTARGEEVRAYVALEKGAVITPEGLRAFCDERLARYKVPKEVIVMESLPKGPTGKLLKRELRQMAIKEMETA